MWSGIWHYTQTLGCRGRRVDVAVLTTSRCDHAKSSSTSWVHLYRHRVVTYNFDIPGWQHYRVCDVQYSIGMSKRQSTVGFTGANIGDQSQACETRSCLFLYPCSRVDICTDIHTEYSTHYCFCITFKNLRAVHYFQVIRRAVQKTYYHCSRTTGDYCV